MCRFYTIPAIFVGFKYLGGMKEIKEVQKRALLKDVMNDAIIK